MTLKTALRIFSVVFLLTGLMVPFTYAKDTCTDCHKDEKFRVQNMKLYVYYNNWKDSAHDVEKVKCFNCHGGNPKATDKDESHKNSFSSFRADDKDSFKIIPRRCGKCHKKVFVNFMKSKHYKALVKEGKGPNCVTCHGSMNTQIYRASAIADTCAFCHNEETKNLPEAGKIAEKTLHNINISTAYRGWVLKHYTGVEDAKKLNKRFKDIANSWHMFDFKETDKKVDSLLSDLKSLVKKGLAEKREKRKETK